MMKVSLRLLTDIDLDNDCCMGLEQNLIADGTWWWEGKLRIARTLIHAFRTCCKARDTGRPS